MKGMIGMKVTLIITGSISAYKAAGLTSALTKQGHEVFAVMTKSATKFIAPLTIQTLSKRPVFTDMFNEQEPEHVTHIELGQNTDLIVVAPATANIIGKAAHGIADDLASSILVAATKPVFFVPAMNSHMYNNKIVQRNIGDLQSVGYKFIEPDEGMLACGKEGKGKFPRTQKIIDAINDFFCI